MKNIKIHPAIWFDQNGVEAATFYGTLFEDSEIISQTPVSVLFKLKGYQILGINGGPVYSPNPSISFYVECDTEAEIVHKFESLSQDGKIMMALDKYPWAEKYAFIEDRYNVSWQLNLRSKENGHQKITPSLLFVNRNNGNASKALELYTSLFNGGKIKELSHYMEGSGNTTGHVLFSRAEIEGFQFIAMDGPGFHDFDFNEGVSFVVYTETQDETDHYWDNLIKNGGSEGQCGWLKDPFGISWQIIPRKFMEIISEGNPEKTRRIFDAMMPMKKLILADLLKAAEKK